jgi:hypothetical protein
VAEVGEVALADWVAALRKELGRAQSLADGEDVRFAVGPIELELELASSLETGGRGDIKFWVVGVGGSLKHVGGTTQRVRFTLVPEHADGRPVKVSDRLTEKPD